MKEKNKLDYAKDILVSLFGGYAITVLGIVSVALLLLFFQISENMVDIGIIIIYIVSCLGAGFIVGKRTKVRKFLWGMVSGMLYFLILMLVSLLMRHSLGNIGSDLATAALICIGSGTLGGMIS